MKYKKAIVALSAVALLLAGGAVAAFATHGTSEDVAEDQWKMLEERGIYWFPDGSVAYWAGDRLKELEERGIRLLPDGSFEQITPDQAAASPAVD